MRRRLSAISPLRFGHPETLLGMATGALPVADEAKASTTLADEREFARLFEQFADDVIRVSYIVCGDREMARDAAQAGWQKAWANRHHLRRSDRLKQWLIAIAANEARRLSRRQRRRRTLESIIGARAATGTARFDAGLAERLDLKVALARLEPDERLLLALRYVAGYSSGTIATMTGKSPAAVRMRLSRLQSRLREELEDG